MLKSNMDTAPPRRAPVRVDHDGPWSVSVAESPHDPRSYCLYIKTPTHNLTLTRSVVEIVELDHKLRESNLPNTTLPKFPLDPATLPLPVPKRKSAFLNTLSRLASPTSNKSAKHSSSTSASRRPTTSGASPVTSPSNEANDPFQSFTDVSLPTPTANSTALASYFTTLSNTAGVRQARVWKRFVRVRTDDLESVRVERPLKHVRSDLAAHLGLSKDKKDKKKDASSVVATPEGEVQKDLLDQDEGMEEIPAQSEAKKTAAADEMDIDVDSATSPSSDTPTTAQATKKVIDITTPRVSEDEPRTPSAAHPATTPTTATAAEFDATSTAESESQAPAPTSTAAATVTNRVPRSHSADPDRRMSRAYLSSSVSGDQTETSQTETGDESSSISTSRRPGATRKKKSAASTPGASSDTSRPSTAKEGKTRKSQRKVNVDDFEMLRVLGKGCAGKVLLVRQKTTADLFAMKAITKRHVLAHQELQHTLTEQAVLRRMSAAENSTESGGVKDPFVVKLWWSFHDKENLFLVMDFHPGGDLATQLARWGRLGRDRARFYAAEIVEGVEGLHTAGVIYRDLKPENILIGADGHIVLTDFGLSKEFPAKRAGVNGLGVGGNNSSAGGAVGTTAPPTPSGTHAPTEFVSAPWSSDKAASQVDQTTTFCGTAEYLAPEVIQGLPYSYEVDWWSFGTMLFEMLTGITPFWANNHADMYMRVLQDELQFPDDRAIDQDTKSLLRGLLQRNPALRICEPRIKRHPYFSMIDWSHVYYKRYIPPYIPPIDPSNASDTQNFDDTFLDMEPVLDDAVDDEEDPSRHSQDEEEGDDDAQTTDTDRTDGDADDDGANTTPSQSRSSSAVRPRSSKPKDEKANGKEEEELDVFDGYSFKGRHSVLIGSDEEEGEDGSEEETDEDEEEGDEEDGIGALQEPAQEAQKELQHRESEQPNQPVPNDIAGEDDEDAAEPKTPEARPVTLPPEEKKSVETTPSKDDAAKASPAVEHLVETKPRKSKELSGTVEEKEKQKEEKKDSKESPAKGKPVPPPKVPPPPPAKTGRTTRPRKERSGVPALDKYLSDGPDEDANTERDEFDDEDDDWDFVEAVDGEDRNGAKGTSLFARGVVDRYRLAVFNRKASTPGKPSRASRSASGMSSNYGSEVSTPPRESPTAGEDSPTGSPSQKRGRNPGLTFRKHPRQFLRPKSPPSSYSPKSSGSTTARSSIPSSLAASNSNTLSSMTSMSKMSTTSSGSGLLVPSSSSLSNGGTTTSTLAGTQPHSLKSKESELSMGGRNHSSDQSNPDASATDLPSPGEDQENLSLSQGQLKGAGQQQQQKNKKLKKYKENAEKVLSLFSAAPKQALQQQQQQQQQTHA
ncbi:hypothetical protein K435DRAFT_858139 [Dendrothele bispora CBS 962.96]|uniref:non-specific serine/threonine protein kinase n=1 Tax=Dendrothele bispora (strain CBS 962.96) TaxID=1314807 RepID=A0A4S8M4D9_DENBC|nr:hypothetical protein K435DRAFT_858139 [Dendrothele bispora CBS 962.96]